MRGHRKVLFLWAFSRCRTGICEISKLVPKPLDSKIAIYYTSTIPSDTQTKEIKTMAALLPEGYTVRKVGNTLKVVPMRKRRVAIVEEKEMLKAVRATIGKKQIFEWQESLQKTILANKDQSFTADEMYAALESVCREGEDLDSKQFVTEYLNGFVKHPFPPFRVRKDGDLYKHVG